MTIPWWNVSLKRQVKKKLKMWKKYVQTRSCENYRQYKAQRNKTTSELQEARRYHENMLAQMVKKQPKKLFKYIRSQQQVKANVGTLVREDKTETSTDKEAAEVLQHFSSQFLLKKVMDHPLHSPIKWETKS